MTDDIEVHIPEDTRRSRAEVEQLRDMLDRALAEFDKRNR